MEKSSLNLASCFGFSKFCTLSLYILLWFHEVQIQLIVLTVIPLDGAYQNILETCTALRMECMSQLCHSIHVTMEMSTHSHAPHLKLVALISVTQLECRAVFISSTLLCKYTRTCGKLSVTDNFHTRQLYTVSNFELFPCLFSGAQSVWCAVCSLHQWSDVIHWIYHLRPLSLGDKYHPWMKLSHNSRPSSVFRPSS